MERIINLQVISKQFKDIRGLLMQKNEAATSASCKSSINQELDEAAAMIETALTKTFNRALQELDLCTDQKNGYLQETRDKIMQTTQLISLLPTIKERLNTEAVGLLPSG